MSYRGCAKVDTAQALLEHLKVIFPAARFIIHRDRDFLNDEKLDVYRNNFSDVYFLIPEFNDIESFFISSSHLQEVLKLSEGEIAEIIQSAFKKRKYDLIKKYVDLKKNKISLLKSNLIKLENWLQKRQIFSKNIILNVYMEKKC